jgi:ferritin-like metal-binding protein YciE
MDVGDVVTPNTMTSPETTLTQLLAEAHAGEVALISVLTEQIAMAPEGSLRDALERHLDETRSHAERIQERLGDLGEHRSLLESAAAAVYATAELVVAQGLALAKTPFDLARGGLDVNEKVLKNVRDACATEALEIAQYDAIEEVAKAADDPKTAQVIADIRADEERMLETLRGEIPALAATLVGDEKLAHRAARKAKAKAAAA